MIPRLIPGLLPQRSCLRGPGSSPAANRMPWATLVLGGCLPSSVRELFTKVFYPPRRNFALHKLLSLQVLSKPCSLLSAASA